MLRTYYIFSCSTLLQSGSMQMVSKKRNQRFLFQPCNYSADEGDSGDNDVSHDYDEKDDLYRYI